MGTQQRRSGQRGQQPRSGSARSQQGSASGARQQEQRTEGQQSQLGGHKDFAHRMQNEGREQNRERQDVQSQESGQNVHGEGNYAATRQYDEATRQYVESGRVESDARAAAPRSKAEAREMEAAEAEGKRHAKGEDPALNRRASSSGQSSDVPRPGQEEE